MSGLTFVLVERVRVAADSIESYRSMPCAPCGVQVRTKSGEVLTDPRTTVAEFEARLDKIVRAAS